MFNEELFWLSFGDIITNIVTITVITLEVGLVIWLLLRWLKKNLNWAPVVNIGGLSRGGKTYGNSPIEMVEEKWRRLAFLLTHFQRLISRLFSPRRWCKSFSGLLLG